MSRRKFKKVKLNFVPETFVFQLPVVVSEWPQVDFGKHSFPEIKMKGIEEGNVRK